MNSKQIAFAEEKANFEYRKSVENESLMDCKCRFQRVQIDCTFSYVRVNSMLSLSILAPHFVGHTDNL